MDVLVGEISFETTAFIWKTHKIMSIYVTIVLPRLKEPSSIEVVDYQGLYVDNQWTGYSFNVSH